VPGADLGLLDACFTDLAGDSWAGVTALPEPSGEALSSGGAFSLVALGLLLARPAEQLGTGQRELRRSEHLSLPRRDGP
jgi:hypothetical protein